MREQLADIATTGGLEAKPAEKPLKPKANGTPSKAADRRESRKGQSGKSQKPSKGGGNNPARKGKQPHKGTDRRESRKGQNGKARQPNKGKQGKPDTTTKKSLLKGFAEQYHNAFLWIAMCLGVPLEWLVRENKNFRKVGCEIRVIVLHSRADLECLTIAWVIARTRQVREMLRIRPDASYIIMNAGELDVDHPSLASIPRAHRNVRILEDQYGFLFIDCGGGGARFDQHGRQENLQRSEITSLHLLIAAIFEILPEDLIHLVPLLEVVAENDRYGTRIARGFNLRNWIDALYDNDIPVETVARYVFLALDGAEQYCLKTVLRLIDERGSEGKAMRAFRDEHIEDILSMKTIMKNLPRPLTEVEAEQEGVNEANRLIAQAESAGQTYTDDDAALLEEQLVRFMQDKARAYPSFIREARGLLKIAKITRQQAWEKAGKDFSSPDTSVRLLKDIAYRRATNDRTGERPWRTECGPIHLVVGFSKSSSFGAFVRGATSRTERARLEELLCKELLKSEKGRLVRPLRPNDIRNIVHGVVKGWQAPVVCVQIQVVEHDKDGNVLRYRFNIHSSGINLDEVVVAVRRARLGDRAPSHGLYKTGHLKVRGVVVDYFAEFGTSYGNWFKSNQGMVTFTMPIDELLEAVKEGLLAGDEYHKGRAKQFDRRVRAAKSFLRRICRDECDEHWRKWQKRRKHSKPRPSKKQTTESSTPPSKPPQPQSENEQPAEASQPPPPAEHESQESPSE